MTLATKPNLRPDAPPQAGIGHVIVFGNEKGGTGKTTTAMHVAIALTRLGRKVAVIDLDGRQRTFGRYIENRAQFMARDLASNLIVPDLQIVERGRFHTHEETDADEVARFNAALDRARSLADFIIIDTPGSDTWLARLGHSAADTLVTPMNDSFVDFDLLARLDPDSYEIKGPSLYSEFVWECRKRRLMARRAPLDWVVMRNRIASSEARNKKRVTSALDSLASRIGFRVAPGFSERVIFRELFPLGLTLFDLPQPGVKVPLTMSHVAARQEIRQLLAALNLPGLGNAAAGA